MLVSCLLLSCLLSIAWADPCPSNLHLPFSTYTEEMGCVYADPYDMFETYEPAVERCREILGDSARLVEVNSVEDQAAILPIMLAAEKYFYPNLDEECLTWWWSGLTDLDDDGLWEWPESGQANYTNWHVAAVPEIKNFNCMQFLSATCSGTFDHV